MTSSDFILAAPFGFYSYQEHALVVFARCSCRKDGCSHRADPFQVVADARDAQCDLDLPDPKQRQVDLAANGAAELLFDLLTGWLVQRSTDPEVTVGEAVALVFKCVSATMVAMQPELRTCQACSSERCGPAIME